MIITWKKIEFSTFIIYYYYFFKRIRLPNKTYLMYACMHDTEYWNKSYEYSF